ncbi:MAG: MarR family transcriptional regulator [Clostridia bacterium]|nr:MarR family transcriptional regulator [Clostridia bacterium]
MTRAQTRCLLAVLALSQDGGAIASKDVADRLGIKRPTAHRTLTALADSGWIKKEYYGEISLTPSGREQAERLRLRLNRLTACLTARLSLDCREAEQAAVYLMTELPETTLLRLEALS